MTPARKKSVGAQPTPQGEPEMGHRMQVFGTVTVGSRGQVVLPADMRRELGISTGDRLVALRKGPGRGVLLIPVAVLEVMLEHTSRTIADTLSEIRDSEGTESVKHGNGNNQRGKNKRGKKNE